MRILVPFFGTHSGRRGIILPKKNIYNRFESFVDEKDSLLIFDEVQCGVRKNW